MAELVWDQIGERSYQTGIDRGVLYLPNGSGVPWNGLVSVTEQFEREIKVFHLDGVKYLECHVLSEYSSELKAFTYPDEFDDINGIVYSDGILFHDQPPSRFGLTYRTMLGDDVTGTDRGYKIHILWNLMAVPSNIVYTSMSNQDNPLVFTWNISGTPVSVEGYKPTCHVSIDTTKITAYDLGLIEDMLYGTATTAPNLPSLLELLSLDDLIIIDNGDGTWTAVGPDRFITMLDSTTFQIANADATFIDANTYTISSTFT